MIAREKWNAEELMQRIANIWKMQHVNVDMNVNKKPFCILMVCAKLLRLRHSLYNISKAGQIFKFGEQTKNSYIW